MSASDAGAKHAVKVEMRINALEINRFLSPNFTLRN